VVIRSNTYLRVIDCDMPRESAITFRDVVGKLTVFAPYLPLAAGTRLEYALAGQPTLFREVTRNE
jgi:hypothetical protein